MALGLLFLGLLPLIFLPEMISSDVSEDDETEDEEVVETTSNSLLDEPVGTDVLDPIIEDDDTSFQETDEVLQPVIDIDTANPTEPDPDDVLPPTIEIDLGSDEIAEDVIAPVDDIDSEDTHWVNYDEATGTGYAEISDFDTGIDVLKITMSGDAAETGTDVSVEPSVTGLDSEIYVGDTLVAVLIGAMDVPEVDVIVDINDDLFA